MFLQFSWSSQHQYAGAMNPTNVSSTGPLIISLVLANVFNVLKNVPEWSSQREEFQSEAVGRSAGSKFHSELLLLLPVSLSLL